MKASARLDRIWESWQITRDCMKIAQRSIDRGYKEILGRTGFLMLSSKESENLIMKSREDSDDYLILYLWAAFERTLMEYMKKEGGKILDDDPGDFNRKTYAKIQREMEFWKSDDILDMFKETVDSNLIGNAKQIKKYRDWVAHRNPEKPAPPNISPQSTYQILSRILNELEKHPDFCICQQ